MKALVTRSFIGSFIVALVCACTAHAQETRFTYDREKSPVGTVYHYTKSNLDGSEPWRLTSYVSAASRIDVLKWGPEPGQFVNVTADFDWNRATATHIEQWNIHDGQLGMSLFGETSVDGKTLALRLANGQGLDVAVDEGPIHVFGFDLQSLNVAFRYLTDPKKGFEAGLIGVNVAPTPERPQPVISFGRTRFEFAGEEMLHNAPCLKYRIVCDTFKDKPATIWFNRDQGHIEKIESQIPNSTDWKTYKLELTKTEKMTPFEWQAFKRGVVDKQIEQSRKDDGQ